MFLFLITENLSMDIKLLSPHQCYNGITHILIKSEIL